MENKRDRYNNHNNIIPDRCIAYQGLVYSLYIVSKVLLHILLSLLKTFSFFINPSRRTDAVSLYPIRASNCKNIIVNKFLSF